MDRFHLPYVARWPLAAGVLAVAALTIARPAAASPGPHWTADSWRSAARPAKPVRLSQRKADIGPVMPLYEVAMVSRLCADAEFRERTGADGRDCARALYSRAENCTVAFHDRFPRGDDAEIDGRLSHRNFAEGYLRCLRDEYGKESRRRRPRRPNVERGA
jgi:hypothetical protein